MRRFGLKSLLIVTTVIAIWLATFSVPDQGLQGAGAHIRRAMLVMVLIAAGVAAVCNRGRRRAFWSAFCAMMLLLMVDVIGNYYRPNLHVIAQSWATNSSTLRRSSIAIVFYCIVRDGLVLAFATASGLLARWIYDQSQKSTES